MNYEKENATLDVICNLNIKDGKVQGVSCVLATKKEVENKTIEEIRKEIPEISVEYFTVKAEFKDRYLNIGFGITKDAMKYLPIIESEAKKGAEKTKQEFENFLKEIKESIEKTLVKR